MKRSFILFLIIFHYCQPQQKMLYLNKKGVKRMKNKNKGTFKKILLIIGLLFLILVIFFGYIIVEDLKQEDILKQEIVNVSNKDLKTDDYKIEVKTKGDYAYIEEAVKKYYKELSDNVKIINHYFNNEEFTNILSPKTLEERRPNFQSSYQLISSTKKNTLEAFNKISSLCDEKTIKTLIDKDKVDDYSYDLYLELMYTKEDIKEMKEIKENMQTLSNDMEQFLDKVIEVLDLLKENNSSWRTENDQIYFDSNELVNRYNNLYNDLQEISSRLSDDSKDISNSTQSSDNSNSTTNKI